jgi:hypothetical protein
MERCRRWVFAAKRPVIANIGPDPAGDSLKFREYGHRRVVGVDAFRAHDIGLDRHNNWVERHHAPAQCPVWQSSAFKHVEDQDGHVAALTAEPPFPGELAVQDQSDDLLAHAEGAPSRFGDVDLAGSGHLQRLGAIEQLVEEGIQVLERELVGAPVIRSADPWDDQAGPVEPVPLYARRVANLAPLAPALLARLGLDRRDGFLHRWHGCNDVHWLVAAANEATPPIRAPSCSPRLSQ